MILDDALRFGSRDFITTATPRSRLEVNLQALYPRNYRGEPQPLGLTQSLAFVTRLLSSKRGPSESTRWERFARLVLRYASFRSERLDTGVFGLGGLSYRLLLSLLSDPQRFETLAFVVSDADKAHDLLPSFAESVRCSSGKAPEAAALSQLRPTSILVAPHYSFRATLRCDGAWERASPSPSMFLEIAAILLQEHGHHLKAYGLKLSHEELDRHGAVLRQYQEAESRKAEHGSLPPDPILPRDERPAVHVLGFHPMCGSAFCNLRLLFVKDREALYELTTLFGKAASCYGGADWSVDGLFPQPFASSETHV